MDADSQWSKIKQEITKTDKKQRQTKKQKGRPKKPCIKTKTLDVMEGKKRNDK